MTVRAPDGSVVAVFEDGAAGDSQNQPSLGDAHDQAMKTALSQGLKRCAVNLGDQFGLSLYNGGSLAPVVVRSLVSPVQGAEGPSADDAPAVTGGEMDEVSVELAAPTQPEQAPPPPQQRQSSPPQRDPSDIRGDIKRAAEAAGMDLNLIASQWSEGHGGEFIGDATDVPGLERVLADLRALVTNGAKQ